MCWQTRRSVTLAAMLALSRYVVGFALIIALVGCGGNGGGDAEKPSTEGDAARPSETTTRSVPARPTKFDTQALEERLRYRFKRLAPKEPWRASCPANVELNKGARFTCTVRGPAVLWTFTITQLDDVSRRVRTIGTPTYKRPVPSKYTIKAIEDLGKPKEVPAETP